MAFDYSSRDYETIRRDLILRADRVMPEWTDRDPADFGMLLLDLWAYAADVNHFYTDRAAGEAYLTTATLRESVLAFANLLDYVPQGRASAQGTITVQNGLLTDHTVERYDTFVASAKGVQYTLYATTTTSVPAGSAVAVAAAEGTPVIGEVLTAGSLGTAGQRYTLARENVAPSSLEVFVYENGIDPVEYTRVSRLSTASNGSRVFSTNVNADRELEIVFDSALNGYTPPTGSLITANYVVSEGVTGNLPAGVVTAFKSGSPSSVFVASSSAFSGGIDEESVTSMKTSIPSVISAQNRCVTRNDFVAMALQLSGVAKVSMTFTQGAGTADNVVVIYPQPSRAGDYLTTPDTSEVVTAALQDRVIESIQPKALLGVEVQCAATIDWTPIDLTCEVFVNATAVSNYVKRDVEAAIDTLFEFDNVHFGQLMTLGQVYRLVLNVPGVDYVDITVFDTSALTGKQETILIDPLQLPKKGVVTLTMTGGVTTS